MLGGLVSLEGEKWGEGEVLMVVLPAKLADARMATVWAIRIEEDGSMVVMRVDMDAEM